MKVSVIDLGFNSLKLVAYEVKQDSSFSVIDQKSVPARLGEGLNQTGLLGSTPIRRAMDGLRFFKEVNEFNAVRHCLPVATSAVREAANSGQFLNQVFSETGFKFRVLSGKEEALYSYAGASRALGQPNMLFFDIGGGSLELVYSEGFKVKKILSLPLGGLRLTQMYGELDSSFKQKNWDRMENRAFELLPSKGELGLCEAPILVGAGGNLRALARWDQEIRDYPLNKLHNYTMKRQSIVLMTRELSNMSAREIAEVDMIGKDRAETLAAGSLVVEAIMKKLGFTRLTISTHGLRDGVLSSFLDDPIAYHRGKISKTVRRTLRPDGKAKLLPSIKGFVGMLQSFDLIDNREGEILAYELKWIMSGNSDRPEVIFYSMTNDESYLTHRDQLVAALAAVESRRPRSTEWLYRRYKSMLKGKKNKQVIKKIAATSKLLEILLRTDSKIKFSTIEGGSRIRLRATPGRPHFPETLFGIAVKELGDVIDRFLEYSIKYRKPGTERLVTLEGLE